MKDKINTNRSEHKKKLKKVKFSRLEKQLFNSTLHRHFKLFYDFGEIDMNVLT